VTLKSGSLKVIEIGAIQKLRYTVSYSASIVTMAISVAVCEIFSVKEWCDLENRVRVRSRSLEMAPFDRSHTRYIHLLVENREIVIPHLYLSPPRGSEFREGV